MESFMSGAGSLPVEIQTLELGLGDGIFFKQ